MYFRNTIILLLFILISSCAVSKQETAEKGTLAKEKKIAVPMWFLELPDSDLSIGISKLSFREGEMKKAAFENAVVNYCRNQSSYIVNNEAFRKSDLEYTAPKATFQVVVSSEPEMLREMESKMICLDSFSLFDNYIGLYGIAKQEINNMEIDLILSGVNEVPDWYTGNVKEDPEYFLVSDRATSSDFMNAWQECQDNCRLKMAKFLETEVGSRIYHLNGQGDKLVSLESQRKMGEMHFKRNYLSRKMLDGTLKYQVFLEMEMKK